MKANEDGSNWKELKTAYQAASGQERDQLYKEYARAVHIFNQLNPDKRYKRPSGLDTYQTWGS